MKWTILLVFIVFSIVLIKAIANNDLEKPFIDYITLDYQSAEQSLWAKINNHADTQSIYAQIVDEHERFFGSDFGETITLRHLYVPLSPILIENLQRLTGTFQSAKNVLRISRNDSVLAEDAIDAFGRDYLISSTRNSDNIYHEISRAQFWNKGKNYFEFCRNGLELITIESEYHLVYNYYKDVRSALLKGYILTQLSYMLLTVRNLGSNNYHEESLRVHAQFNERNEQIRRNIKNVLRISSRDSWNCDPKPANNTHAYDQVTNFLQGYIDNEINFNDEQSCTNNCIDYKKVKSNQCAEETMCAQNKRLNDTIICNGDIYDCIELDAIDVDVCHTGNVDPLRRYTYIRYSNGRIIGQNPTECAVMPKAKTWRRWFVKCSSCYCLCDDPSNSERYFSLHEVVSDIRNNKVVTGVRILKQNGVFQLAISERTLLPYGETNRFEDNTWKLANYKFTVKDSAAIDGVDYITLTHDNRAINLDELIIPQGKLVTGVRFFNQNGHIALQIRATDFNYFSGQLLNVVYTPWVANLDGGKHEIHIDQPGIPTDQHLDINLPTKYDENSFINFGPSDFELDIGQTTVPFIETIPIESKHPVILGGIGLIHKSQATSGGVIALKLISYEFPIADSSEEEFDYID